jgi:hypothetical protein
MVAVAVDVGTGVSVGCGGTGVGDATGVGVFIAKFPRTTGPEEIAGCVLRPEFAVAWTTSWPKSARTTQIPGDPWTVWTGTGVGVPGDGVGVGVPTPKTWKLVFTAYCWQSLTSVIWTGTVTPGGVCAGTVTAHRAVPVASVTPPQKRSRVGKWKTAYICTPGVEAESVAKFAWTVSG